MQDKNKKRKSWQVLSTRQQQAFDILEEDKKITTLGYLGSAGSGKSGLISIWLAYRAIKYAGSVGGLCRKNLTDLYKTTLVSFEEFWQMYFVHHPSNITYKINRQYNYIDFSNGSRIYLLDLGIRDNDVEFQRLGSLGLTHLAIDEVTEITEKAYTIILTRVRHLVELTKAKIPKTLITGNPAPNWVRDTFIQDKEGNPVILKPHQFVIHAGLNDNPNENFRNIQRKNLEDSDDEYTKARLLYGDWSAQETNNNPFFFSWSRDKHQAKKELTLSKHDILNVSFDFNNEPGTAVMWIQRESLIYFLDMLQINGGTELLCEEILRKYGDEIEYRVTGDASGHQRRSSAAFTDWEIVKDVLGLTKRQMILRRSNLTHVESRSLCNQLLKKVNIVFHPVNCRDLIEEIERAKTTSNGKGLYKSTQRGIGFDMDGVDAFRYSVNIICPKGKKDIDRIAGLGQAEHVEDVEDTKEKETWNERNIRLNREYNRGRKAREAEAKKHQQFQERWDRKHFPKTTQTVQSFFSGLK